MKSKRIAYIRVSSLEQNESRQIVELQALNLHIDEIIIEKSSGAAKLPKLTQLLDDLQAGDELIILSIDRLGRSLRANLAAVDLLKSRGVKIRAVREALFIDPEHPNARDEFLYTFYTAYAALELSLAKERQMEGVKAKQQRPGPYNKHQAKRIALLKNPKFRNQMKIKTKSFMMAEYGFSSTTYHKYKRLILNKQ